MAAVFAKQHSISALLFTILMALLFLLPLSWLIGILITESQLFINFLQQLNKDGGAAPDFFTNVPFVSHELIEYWDANVGKPGNIKSLLSNLHLSLTPASYYIKQISFDLAHRGFQVGFTILTLFFFYRDGDKLLEQIHHVGEACLGKRWFRYSDRLPKALRGTVNGTIVVGIGVGILNGYLLCFSSFSRTDSNGIYYSLSSYDPFCRSFNFYYCSLSFSFSWQYH